MQGWWSRSGRPSNCWTNVFTEMMLPIFRLQVRNKHITNTNLCPCHRDEWLPGLNDSPVISPYGWNDSPGRTVTPHQTSRYSVMQTYFDVLWSVWDCGRVSHETCICQVAHQIPSALRHIKCTNLQPNIIQLGKNGWVWRSRKISSALEVSRKSKSAEKVQKQFQDWGWNLVLQEICHPRWGTMEDMCKKRGWKEENPWVMLYRLYRYVKYNLAIVYIKASTSKLLNCFALQVATLVVTRQ